MLWMYHSREVPHFYLLLCTSLDFFFSFLFYFKYPTFSLIVQRTSLYSTVWDRSSWSACTRLYSMYFYSVSLVFSEDNNPNLFNLSWIAIPLILLVALLWILWNSQSLWDGWTMAVCLRLYHRSMSRYSNFLLFFILFYLLAYFICTLKG